MKDPLAFWRNKDKLPLSDAAALLCECEPGLTYDHRNSEERRERDRIKTARARLEKDIEDGTLKADTVYVERAAERGTNFVTREPTYSPAARWLDTKQTTIPRADLRAWCEANGLRPSILFSEPSAPAEAKPLTSVESDAQWVSRELALANRAAREFWSTAEPDTPSGHPTKSTVGAWLKEQDSSLAKEAIARITTLIRPNWAATGRRRGQ